MIPHHAENCKGRFHALTNEELALKFQAGDGGAFNDLAVQNKGLVRILAARLWQSLGGDANTFGMEFDDCLQLASMGLYGAAVAYDQGKGFKFTAYIKRQMYTAFRDLYGRQAKDVIATAISGDEEIGENNDTTRLDLVADDSTAAAFEDGEDTDYWRQVRGVIDKAVAALPARQKEAVRGYYLEGETQTAIAARQGLGKERVRQNIGKGLEALQRKRRLQGIARELWGAKVYRNTGAAAFRTRQGSNPELLLEWVEERQRRERERVLEEDAWLGETAQRWAEYRAQQIADAWSGEVRHRKPKPTGGG
jgi:RNA polymerase sigma factor (sigma-70 family)